MNNQRARRRTTQLKTVSLAANKHALTSGPLRGRVVGSLTTEVLDDQKLVLGKLGETTGTAGPSAAGLNTDLKAIESELQRRWLAFTA